MNLVMDPAFLVQAALEKVPYPAVVRGSALSDPPRLPVLDGGTGRAQERGQFLLTEFQALASRMQFLTVRRGQCTFVVCVQNLLREGGGLFQRLQKCLGFLGYCTAKQIEILQVDFLASQ